VIPNKLLIPTDSNELELVRIIKGKENNYEYKFTRSETKLGMLMTMSEEQLKNNLRKNIIKTIINE
jgi:hypothetical protein